MSRYYYGGSKKKRSRREKIGFYTALSICLIAVAMAVYSTYNTVSRSTATRASTTLPSNAVAVAEPVTGITVPIPTLGTAPVAPPAAEESETEQQLTTLPTVVSESEEPTTARKGSKSDDALETMLSADLSLSFPTKDGKVLREFSRDSVYYKTLNVWKPHTGVDFASEPGDDVFAMTRGEVTGVTEDPMFGKTVELSVNDVVCTYSGLGTVKVKEGDNVEAGDKIATAGTVPIESSDKNHIHVSVKISGKYADPLSFISNNE